jgi:hypothetical protein
VRVRIDDARCNVLAARIDYRDADRSADVIAKGGDLAVFYVDAGVRDFSVRYGQQRSALDQNLFRHLGGVAGRLRDCGRNQQAVG